MSEQELEYIDRMTAEYKKRLTDFVSNNDVFIESLDVEFDKYATMIADFFAIDCERMTSKATRRREYVLPRRMLLWFCRNKFGNRTSLGQLGRFCGGFDHATVLYQIKKFNEDYAYDSMFKDDADGVMNRLGYRVQKLSKENYTIEQIDLQL